MRPSLLFGSLLLGFAALIAVIPSPSPADETDSAEIKKRISEWANDPLRAKYTTVALAPTRKSSPARTTPPKWTKPAKPHARKTGAKPTPRRKLIAASRYKVAVGVPKQFAIVPDQLSWWNNDTDGDCVTAEEAFAKACYQPEIFIPDTEVVRWATAGGYLNAAVITDVMDSMIQSGFRGTGSQLYNDGQYTAVDYSTESVLQSAIADGPVKIGIDSTALPATAGNVQGWYATGGTPGQFSAEDHCVSLCGFGPAGWLYGQLGVALPADLKTDQAGYLLFTWSTIGFVDYAWIMSTTGEAWLRSPTTVGDPPLVTPPSPPKPGTNPITSLTATFQDGSTQTITSGTAITPQTTLAELAAMLQATKSPPTDSDPAKTNAQILQLLQKLQKQLDEKSGK